MIQLSCDHVSYNFSWCQQCGACGAVCPKEAISFKATGNGLKCVVIDEEKCIKCKKCEKVCPANRVLGNQYIESLSKKKYFFAWNADNKKRHDSSSGGATKTLIIESLKSGFVDGVYSLRKLDTYPSAVGEFYTKDNIPSFQELPNSVYHSIMMCTDIHKVQKVKRLMIVGTSCQLYALEKALKGKYDDLIKICIFCKQQKHLDNTKFLSKIIGEQFDLSNLKTQYRGTGWPGFVKINNKSIAYERAAGLSFGRRLWIVPGCDICGDPFGMEATNVDITVMDPWFIRKENELGETLVTVHSKIGERLITGTHNLCIDEKTYMEVEPALGIGDIKRKRMCIPYFKGENVEPIVAKAAKAEVKQRKHLEWFLKTFPKLPFFCYRIINKIVPKRRNKILK